MVRAGNDGESRRLPTSCDHPRPTELWSCNGGLLTAAERLLRMNPHVIAIIPARGGSKGVPGKNLRRIGGRSLIERAVDACRAARLVDAVYVSTDDAEIATTAEAAGANVIMRPAELSGG